MHAMRCVHLKAFSILHPNTDFLWIKNVLLNEPSYVLAIQRNKLWHNIIGFGLLSVNELRHFETFSSTKCYLYRSTPLAFIIEVRVARCIFYQVLSRLRYRVLRETGAQTIRLRPYKAGAPRGVRMSLKRAQPQKQSLLTPATVTHCHSTTSAHEQEEPNLGKM